MKKEAEKRWCVVKQLLSQGHLLLGVKPTTCTLVFSSLFLYPTMSLIPLM